MTFQAQGASKVAEFSLQQETLCIREPDCFRPQCPRDFGCLVVFIEYHLRLSFAPSPPKKNKARPSNKSEG